MIRIFTSLVFLFSFLGISAQTLKISGNVQDTIAKEPLQHALTMVMRLNDSTLVKFGRTDKTGQFKIEAIPVDTYIVVTSHPQFADQTFIIVGSSKQTEYDFGRIILPPKSNTLNEVVVFAYKDKVYYKGDTLMFTADSFKSKQNASVEDLLKKLPGVSVDGAGKIKVQGKEVSQVLVDGDEFFGSDPTVATKNLNANTVETVQVYDKKSEDAESADETVKVVNLKLKEDAKKGYFGKVSGSGGTGGNKTFYEGEILANRFNKNRKVSLFALGANSPRQQFNWNDIWQYGLENEYNREFDDDGGEMWSWSGSEQSGIPQTLKSGFYYNDKFSKKTKINTDYSYGNNRLVKTGSTNTQYFLGDTSYTDAQVSGSDASNESHTFNLRLTQAIDSMTDLTIVPKIKYSINKTDNLQTDDFYTEDNILTRQTKVRNQNTSLVGDFSGNARINRRFKKRDRGLFVNYNYNYHTEDNVGYLNSENIFFADTLFNSSTNQQKTLTSVRNEHQASFSYVEPFTKKFKIEFSYDFTINQFSSDKRTKDYSGTAYDLENSALTNNFKNERQVNRGGLNLIYEVKKYMLTVGAKYRQVLLSSLNLTNNTNLSQRVENILPSAVFRYKLAQNASFSITYRTSSKQPELYQLQPVVDNTNPNRISLGNPALKPTFDQSAGIDFYSFKPISNQNIWGGINFNSNSNAIAYNTTYDSLGVATTQPVNVNGNYSANGSLGIRKPIAFLMFSPNLNCNYFENVNFINGEKNITKQMNYDGSLNLEYQGEKLLVSVGGGYNYTDPKSTISNQSNQPYSSYNFSASFEWKLPKKFIISSDATYNNNGQRAAGYNISYVIWNASFGKTFMKSENLIVSLDAYDILNQNINTRRMVMDNRIVDTKSQVIRQYFLLKVILKFNSNKAKEEEGDF
jgi:hypothetical protein